jgi:hypothetical protein
MCLNCVRAFVPRPPTPSAPEPPGARQAEPAPAVRADAPAAAGGCPDRDCPHAGIVPSDRCRACGRCSVRWRASIRFPWGVVDVPVTGKLAVGREDSPIAEHLSAFSNVGRRHATVESVGNHVVVVDLRSANGTFVNGERIPPLEPRIVKHGDRVRFAASVETTVDLERPR